MNKYPFDPSESLAVAKLVWMLIISDGGIDRRETVFFERLLQSLEISSEEFEASLPNPIESVYEIVKNMPAVKRRECGQLLRLAVRSDEVVVLSELSRLNEILEKTHILKPDKHTIQKSEGGFD